MRSEVKVDPVTTEVIRNNLESTVEEMGLIMTKLAHSLIFAETKDFSVGILSKDGELLALAQYVPGHQGGMQTNMWAVLKEIPKEELYPGDIIMANDPYRGGLHTYDLYLYYPIFYAGELVAFACSIAHTIDMGAFRPGFPLDATDIYQEGIRLPIVKLAEKGKLREDIKRIYLTNIRAADEQWADIQALIASLKGAERGVHRLIDKYGVPIFLSTLKAIIDLTEARARAEIERMPDGVYEYTDYLDNDGVTDRIYKLHVSVEIKGSDVHVDFTGTDGQTPGAQNVPIYATMSAVWVGFMYWLDPSLPKNFGMMKPITISAPPGCIFNAQSPAAVGGCTALLGGKARQLVLGALSQAMPERGLASWEHGWGLNYDLSGINPKTGKEYILLNLEGMAVGGGARCNCDGWMASSASSSNIMISSIEIMEQRFPLRYVGREFTRDYGGDGKYRGGPGITYEIEILAPMRCNYVRNRGITPCPGIHGGKPGGPCRSWLIRQGSRAEAAPVWGGFPLNQGDIVGSSTPGGGGYGDPKDRDPEKVKEDLLIGIISKEKAEAVYGLKGEP